MISAVSPRIGVSVIICCYNSGLLIRKTLEHLNKQVFSHPIDWEILVINNASTDDTSKVTTHAATEFTLTNVRLINEEKPGLTHARNRGIAESNFEYLLFCDDDNFLSSNYIQLAFDTMNSSPSIGVLGGQGLFLPEGPPKSWFAGLEQMNMAIGPQGDATGDITFKKGCVYGAGMVVRKTGLKQIAALGITQFCSDRTGNKLLSAGDTELTYIFRLLGYRLYYHSDLKFDHLVSARKLTKDYIWKLYSGFKHTYPVTLAYVHVLGKKHYSTSTLLIDHLQKFFLESLRLMSSVFRTFQYRVITWRNWTSYGHFILNMKKYHEVRAELETRFAVKTAGQIEQIVDAA